MVLIIGTAFLSTVLFGAVVQKSTFHWPDETYSAPSEKIDIKKGGVTFLWGAFYSLEGPMETISHEKIVYRREETVARWTITFDTKKERIVLREVFTLPGPKKVWKVGRNTNISKDQTTAVSYINVRTAPGLFYRGWTIDKNDPLGEYKYEIFYEESLIYSVKFRVQNPPK